MAITAPAVPASGTAVVNTTAQFAVATVTGGTITGILVLPVPAQSLVAPAVPATTVAASNTSTQPVAVTVTGGTVTVIAVNGVSSGLTAGTVVVPAGGTIAITYSVAPTWTWQQAVAGFAGTAIPSPSSVPMPPNSSITLTYSVAPTWAWSNPPMLDGAPAYAAENTFPGYDPRLILPWTKHATGGLTDFATAVSN